MKKLLALALIAVSLFTLCAFALADGELQTVESTQLIYADKDNKYNVFVFCVFENVSDHPVTLGLSKLSICDAAGTPFGEKPTNFSAADIRPMSIQPGERAYFRKRVDLKDVTSPDQISNYTMELVIQNTKSHFEYIDAESMPEFALKKDGLSYDFKVYSKVGNNTDRELDYPHHMCIVRDTKGQLIGVEFMDDAYTMFYPGSFYRARIWEGSGSLTKAWVSSGLEPATVETYCMFEIK